ncbi:MAG: hypothetical protein HC860_03135 [Alkalinema sp. RU_4_3]|nr:hypothetical protein [Alkalinema sp. RU_4_3]
MNFRPELVQRANDFLLSSGLTLPPSVTNLQPTVGLTGRGSVDTGSRIATVTVDQSISVTVDDLTFSGNNCAINSVSSSVAVLSCVLQVTPLTPAKRVPLVRFTGNVMALTQVNGVYSTSSVSMELPTELATLVNNALGGPVLTGGVPLGTASGTARF